MGNGDRLTRFLFDGIEVRGQLVQLDASWRAVLDAHPYPDEVRSHLGEALAAVALLAATVKLDGSLILQIQSSGPIRTLVAQATSARTIRGIARWEGAVQQDGDLAESFGEGRLVLTIQGPGEPYQGIVPLSGTGIADAIERYFGDSEQLPTRLWLAADANRAAGLLLQRLPTSGNAPGDAEDWTRLGMLAETVTAAELTGLPTEDLLYRLFHEERVRLLDPEPVAFRCGCSRARVEDMVRTLGEEEARSILAEQGVIEVTCEFCNRSYSLDAVDTTALFAATTSHEPPPTQQ